MITIFADVKIFTLKSYKSGEFDLLRGRHPWCQKPTETLSSV
jgi:hypothetical protein